MISQTFLKYSPFVWCVIYLIYQDLKHSQKLPNKTRYQFTAKWLTILVETRRRQKRKQTNKDQMIFIIMFKPIKGPSIFRYINSHFDRLRI